MIDWTPAALLPNLSGRRAIEGDVIALAPSNDTRVEAFSRKHPKFRELQSRFANAFGVRLEPAVLIVRDDFVPRLARNEPLASFRDLVALSVIPYSRSLNTVYAKHHRICYSNSFDFYPWILGTDNEYLVARTPAMNAFHVVEEFQGQSSPELPTTRLDDFDKPLFMQILRCWRRYYLSTRQEWSDRALFRSLNMAVHAAKLPASIDVTLYDLGRAVSLWVSAFEILAHPRTAKSDVQTVYSLLERTNYVNDELIKRRYVVHKNGRKRRGLACWLYGKLYQARNNFLHGNPVTISALNHQLFWLAPCLYHCALTGFLGPAPTRKPPTDYSDYRETQAQSVVERALLTSRNS